VETSLINPFITATVHCFDIMLNAELTPGVPIIKQEPGRGYDISGTIGLSGELQGAVSFCFSQAVAERIVSAMTGTPVTAAAPDLADGIGELVNIVAGNAKKDIPAYNFTISLPCVIIGTGHIMSNQSRIPIMIVPFKCTLGEFTMELTFKLP
jgi:chemotaxis protein CheX